MKKNKLLFDPDDKVYSMVPGVTVRASGWGDTDSTAYLDPSLTAWILGNVGSYAEPLFQGTVTVGNTLHKKNNKE